jgi:type II secretory pathway pseudopilin PulG
VTARRGFALAAVLSALVIMSMSVAVSARRALVAARQARLDLARADLAVLIASGQSAALNAPADSTCCATVVPGALLFHGEIASGRARARWWLKGGAGRFATVDVEAEVPTFGGAARASHRVVVAWTRDSAGGARWAIVEGHRWAKLPSP